MIDNKPNMKVGQIWIQDGMLVETIKVTDTEITTKYLCDAKDFIRLPLYAILDAWRDVCRFVKRIFGRRH